MFRIVLVCAVMLFLAVPQHVVGGAKPNIIAREGRSFSQNDEVIPGVVIVSFKRGVAVAEGQPLTSVGIINQAIQENGVTSLVKIFKVIAPVSETDEANGTVDLSRVYYAYILTGLDPREVARQIGTLEAVEYAEPKFMHYLHDTPNDPQVATQTNAFTRMNLFNGWTLGKGDSAVAIATVDGGTYWQHEDLLANLKINPLEDINNNRRFDPGPPPAGDEDGIDQDANGFVDDVIGWNFANNSNNPRGLPATPNSADHGTNTASDFGARTNNGIGMAGSSWNCALLPVCAAAPTSDNGIAFGYEGIMYAAQVGAKVINCSWGRTGGYSLFEQNVITAATQGGALVVVSAGNGTNNNGVGKNNDLSPDFPASYKNALSVGATNSTSDAKASFSNYGLTVPVYAPGVNILSATNAGGYASSGISGTSFSSPLVAGLAGILKVQRPTWTPRQIATQLRVTADSIDAANPSFAGNMGRGRVNLARALTESDPGIEILNSTILTTRGSALFLPNDTIVVTLTIQNILFATANNLSLVATSSDASLTVIQGSATVASLAPGGQATLPNLMYRVGALTASKDIALRFAWTSNTNDRDAYAFKVTVFPSIPLWESQASPTQTSLFSVKAVTQNIVWAAGGSGTGSAPVVIRTTDGGSNWALAGNGLSGVDLYCITAVDANRAWVGTGNGKIFATTNGGSSWAEQIYPGTQSPFINGIWMFSDGTGYAQGDPFSANRFVVLKTTNLGQTWAHLANEPVGGSTEAGWNNSFWFTDTDHGWFGTNLSKVWRTTDGGTTWSSAASGAVNSYGVAFKDNNNGIVGHSTGAIRVSTNGGATWTSVTSPTTSPIIGLSHLAGTNLAWIGIAGTPYRSTNNGTNWSSQSLYPFTGSLQHLYFADTSNGWTVTSNGEVLRYRPAGTVGVEEIAENIPTTFSLDQNYPNPFNPSTSIGFRIVDFGLVSLKVFDVLGREVATLVEGVREPGTYTVVLDGALLTSGLYFYQLKTGRFVDVKKMLLVK